MFAMIRRQFEAREGPLVAVIVLAVIGVLCQHLIESVPSPFIPWIPLSLAAALVVRFGARYIVSYAVGLVVAFTMGMAIAARPWTLLDLGIEVGIPAMAGTVALVTFTLVANSTRNRILEGRIDLRSATLVFLIATPVSMVVWTVVQAEALWIAPMVEHPVAALLAGTSRQWLGLLGGLPILLALAPGTEDRPIYGCHCERRYRVQLAFLAIPAVIFCFHAFGSHVEDQYAVLTMIMVALFAWVAINSGWLASSMAAWIFLLMMMISKLVAAQTAETAVSIQQIEEAGFAIFATTAAVLMGAVAEHQFRQRSKLKDQYATVHHLVQAVDAMAFQTGPQGDLTLMNEEGRTLVESLTGRDAESSGNFASIFDRGLRERFGEGLEGAARGERTEFDFILDRSRERRHFMTAIITPMHDQHERFRGTSVVLMDLTNRRRREIGRRQADRRKLTSLAEAVVHDVNNLTMAIGGTASLARELHQDGDVSQVLADIEQACADAARRTERLRHVIPQPMPRDELVDLGDLLEKTIASYAASERIQIHTLEADRDLLVAVPPRFASFTIEEFLQNAIEASSHAPSIFAACRANDDRVVFILRDDGPGIPIEILDKIGSTIVSTKGGGRGFGLRAIQAGLEAAGGSFSIRSGESGTTVTVDLPLQPSSMPSPVPSPVPSSTGL